MKFWETQIKRSDKLLETLIINQLRTPSSDISVKFPQFAKSKDPNHSMLKKHIKEKSDKLQLRLKKHADKYRKVNL